MQSNRKVNTSCLTSLERNTDYKKKKESAKTDRIMLNSLKNANKVNVYFADQNVRSTSNEKYDRYAKHSFNIKNEGVSCEFSLFLYMLIDRVQ